MAPPTKARFDSGPNAANTTKHAGSTSQVAMAASQPCVLTPCNDVNPLESKGYTSALPSDWRKSWGSIVSTKDQSADRPEAHADAQASIKVDPLTKPEQYSCRPEVVAQLTNPPLNTVAKTPAQIAASSAQVKDTSVALPPLEKIANPSTRRTMLPAPVAVAPIKATLVKSTPDTPLPILNSAIPPAAPSLRLGASQVIPQTPTMAKNAGETPAAVQGVAAPPPSPVLLPGLAWTIPPVPTMAKKMPELPPLPSALPAEPAASHAAVNPMGPPASPLKPAPTKLAESFKPRQPERAPIGEKLPDQVPPLRPAAPSMPAAIIKPYAPAPVAVPKETVRATAIVHESPTSLSAGHEPAAGKQLSPAEIEKRLRALCGNHARDVLADLQGDGTIRVTITTRNEAIGNELVEKLAPALTKVPWVRLVVYVEH